MDEYARQWPKNLAKQPFSAAHSLRYLPLTLSLSRIHLHHSCDRRGRERGLSFLALCNSLTQIQKQLRQIKIQCLTQTILHIHLRLPIQIFRRMTNGWHA